MDLVEILKESQPLVLYPCCGTDWRVITLTTHEFLEYKAGGNIKFQEPSAIAFIDKFVDYNEILTNNVLFDDGRTVR